MFVATVMQLVVFAIAGIARRPARLVTAD